MESFSRRALEVLAALGAGAATAYAVLAWLGPYLVAATMPESGGGVVAVIGALIVGLLVGSMLSALLALLAGLGTTVLVWRALSGRRPLVA